MKNQNIKISKYLSYVLRHHPASIGLQLDTQGWASIEELIACAEKNGKKLSYDLIAEVVATNDKKRFAISKDGERIRANQGHSIPIDLGLAPIEPPEFLFHGTADRFLTSILEKGLLPAGRHHVHLSLDKETAFNVGQRHGKPVILKIHAKQMQMEGYLFYCSENNVWLVDHVPVKFIQVLI